MMKRILSLIAVAAFLLLFFSVLGPNYAGRALWPFTPGLLLLWLLCPILVAVLCRRRKWSAWTRIRARNCIVGTAALISILLLACVEYVTDAYLYKQSLLLVPCNVAVLAAAIGVPLLTYRLGTRACRRPADTATGALRT